MTQSAPSLQVDRNSPVPLYFQVAQHLEHLIESGELATGTRLENEIDLADQLGLSRPTMRRAMQYLVDRGLLVRKRGVGTQVVNAKVRRKMPRPMPADAPESFTRDESQDQSPFIEPARPTTRRRNGSISAIRSSRATRPTIPTRRAS